MAFLHDPKKLTETVELDYFQRPRRFRFVKRLTTWIVFLASLAAIGFTLLPRQRHVYESGSLSTAHAMFNNDCGVCHTQAFQPLVRFVRADPSHQSVTDRTCQQCHAGGDHHGTVSGCADCHREHRGHAVLAQVPDRQCTACHAHLKTTKADTAFEDVPAFTSHPEFALWRRSAPDTGTVRFNHSRHLNLTSQSGLRGIDGPLSRLKEQQCNYCHRTDPAGRYMLPIKYETHCQACHPLQVQVSGDWPDQRLGEALKAFAKEPVPHPARGQGPAMVRALVRDRYLDFAQKHPAVVKTAAADAADPPRPLPGTRRGQPATRGQLAFVEQQVQTAERLLFDGADGCRRCHQERAGARVNGLPDYGKPAIPAHWLAHSKFKHDSHRMLGCLECHAQALTSGSAKEVLMPRMAVCQQCHGSPGGARSDCFECHDFHSRSEPHWIGRKTIKELLND
jgi:hypothetical protein